MSATEPSGELAVSMRNVRDPRVRIAEVMSLVGR
jgi:hypothetical protein